MTDAPPPASNPEDAPQDPPTAATPPQAGPNAPVFPPAPTDPPTQPRRPRAWLAATAGAIAGAALVGSIWVITANQGPDAPATFTLDGAFALTDTESVYNDGDNCYGTGGYDDIATGTSVTVYDAKGATIAVGKLGESHYATGGCLFTVSVADVPKGHGFYKVEISHRGTIELSAEQAEAGELSGTLG